MEQDKITVEEFCHYYSVEVSFIHSLKESGLINMSSENEKYFITLDEMPRVEKFTRLHYDLDINLEGLETIDYLLNKIEELQQEMMRLRNTYVGNVADH